MSENDRRLQKKIYDLRRSLLDAEEEKLKIEVYHALMDHDYSPLEARAVALEAVLHKRKMDSLGIPVVNKNEK